MRNMGIPSRRARELADLAKGEGFTPISAEITGSQHIKLWLAKGSERFFLFCSLTPSDHRQSKKVSSSMRRAYREQYGNG